MTKYQANYNNMASCAINSNHSFVDSLAQLDLDVQSQDFIGRMPKEIFRAILDRVPAHRLILLRSVNKRWKVTIEDICRDKTCLMISSYWYFSYFQLDCKQDSDEIYLSAKLCTLLAKLFPRIEQFFVFAEFSYSSTQFASMLSQWSSSLNTLSLYIGDESPQIRLNLYGQINNLASLKKLHLNKNISGKMVNKLAPTFSRLEHLSGRCCESIGEIVPFLGASFTSLGLNRQSVSKIKEIKKWRTLNAQMVSSLERFSLFVMDTEVLPFICKNFGSLQMLQIAFYYKFKLTPDMSKNLARLTRLTELRIDYTQIDLDTTFDDTTNLTSLRNIQIVSLVNFKFVNGENVIIYYLSPNYVVQFSRVLSAIFPNVDNLTVTSETYPCFGDLLKPNLNTFANLRSFNLPLNDPIAMD